MMFARMLAGEQMAVPHPDIAARWLRDNPLPARPGFRPVAGDPGLVRRRLLDIATAYHAGELLTVNILWDHAARVRSLELVADAFSLGPPTATRNEANHHKIRNRKQVAPAVEAG
jgi:hypothetical protein